MKLLNKIIRESIKKVLTESRSINSKRLYNILKQHGGFESIPACVDVHNITDDDIIEVVDYPTLKEIRQQGDKKYALQHNIPLTPADTIDAVELKDGNYLICLLRGGRFDCVSKAFNNQREKQPGDFEFKCKKQHERNKNKYPGQNDYVWQNQDAEFLFKNPYFKHGNENWTPERKKQVVNNIKNKRRYFENN